MADDVHPQTLDVIRTRAETFGFELVIDAQKALDYDDVFGVLLQQTGTGGESMITLPYWRSYISASGQRGSRYYGAGAAEAPGKQGADIVFGSAQRFGVPMGYGGPHAASLPPRCLQTRHAGTSYRCIQ
ncbi:hypothetical protein ACNKHW_18125 [Shigella flexneri]